MNSTPKLVVPLAVLHRGDLALVGGKGANLGELIRVGLPVPRGFCITTVAYEMITSEAGLEAVLNAQRAEESGHLAEAARNCLLKASLPAYVVAAITEAYRDLGAGESLPVAVRSSATMEDLPFASFAGQQETYLNIVGIEAVLDAVLQCFASLWTDRAVNYRASLGLDQRDVRLAVVVQFMIESVISGVLFTANPLTGKRRQAAIDANPGLGEAVVSGATNPDHFVVNIRTSEIVERHLGDKRIIIRGLKGGGTTRTEVSDGSDKACLADEQVYVLAALGAQVEAHYGTPQDIEWAIDSSGKSWLVQSRPITTLYPLPDNAPETDDVLRVYFSLNVFQGVYRPLTPMGIAIFRLFGSIIASLFHLAPRDPLCGPSILVEAGERLFFDVTSALRTAIGRRFLLGAAQMAEARSVSLFQQLITEPRLSLVPTPRWPLIRAFGSFLLETRAPISILQALLWPSTVQRHIAQVKEWLQSLNDEAVDIPILDNADLADRLTVLEQRLPGIVKRVMRIIPPMMVSGLGSYALSSRLLKNVATPDEMQIVLRGLPHNPTTEMDLDLWRLASQVQGDATAAQSLRAMPPEQLAQRYHEGALPATLQQGLGAFLHAYGHRGVAEIDLGLPRWSENPAYILGVLANYLQLKDANLAPTVQFQHGVQEAEDMVTVLIRRVGQTNWLRGVLVGFFLKRVRALVGFREMPKFCFILLLAFVRRSLLPIGQAMAHTGQLKHAEDIFFLTLSEARVACTGEDMCQKVLERRANYNHELQRRHIPRVLLSDGTQPTAVAPSDPETSATLKGSPASPGKVTARARIILDPAAARLEPGEVLVAPSTDPGWTPLFLTASGLVMEMGGAMSHGAVVAREYGIPAVVGVAGATERIATGQLITVDGGIGTVSLVEEMPPLT